VVSTSESAKLANDDSSDFGDVTGKICLLCARQFKSCEQLVRHNKESDLHKKNLQDTALREVATGKVKASKAKAMTTPEVAPEAPKYRDRASERRIMHNQPDIPLPTPGEKSALKKHFEGPPAPPSPPPPPVAPAQDHNNVGNKLLKMMGWKEGEGLGIEGEGRVDPIQTAMFAQGVGLGASKGKEVGKYQEGFAGYKELARDMTRERYNS
jgi:RNA-binding protein 5/10